MAGSPSLSPHRPRANRASAQSRFSAASSAFEEFAEQTALFVFGGRILRTPLTERGRFLSRPNRVQPHLARGLRVARVAVGTPAKIVDGVFRLAHPLQKLAADESHALVLWIAFDGSIHQVEQIIVTLRLRSLRLERDDVYVQRDVFGLFGIAVHRFFGEFFSFPVV